MPAGKFDRIKNQDPKIGIFHSKNNKYCTFWSTILIWIRKNVQKEHAAWTKA